MPSALYFYLLKRFFLSLFFCISGFVSFAVLIQLNKVSHFATYGLSLKAMLSLLALQVPVILPHIIAFSGFISTLFTTYTLVKGSEITAMRSVGFSMKQLSHPVLLLAAMTSLFTFFFASEIIPLFKLMTFEVVTSKASKPFVMIKHALSDKFSDRLFSQIKLSKKGKNIDQAIFVFNDPILGSLKYLKMEHVHIRGGDLVIDTLVSEQRKETTSGPVLIRETEKGVTVPLYASLQLFQNYVPINYYSTYPLKGLLYRMNKHQLLELLSRIAISLNVFFQMMLGTAFGFFFFSHLYRKWALVVLIGSLANFIAYFAGKSIGSVVLTPLLFWTTALFSVFLLVRSGKLSERGMP